MRNASVHHPWCSDELAVTATIERAPERVGNWDRRVEGVLRSTLIRWGRHDLQPRRIVAPTFRLEAKAASLDPEALMASAQSVGEQLLRHGLTTRWVAESFALAREATFRTLGFRHHPNQVMAAFSLLRGRLVELATGEGKTVTALLAAATAALAGMPVHVVTVNEYLAERDAATLGPIYAALSLNVGLATGPGDARSRQAAYASDVVYCTSKDLVFDYLRDGLARGAARTRTGSLVANLGGGPAADGTRQRGLHFAIVDEADSIFIDEARTPLIISGAAPRDPWQPDYAIALDLARQLVAGRDYKLFEGDRRIELTDDGRHHVATAAAAYRGVWVSPRASEELVTQGLTALLLFHRDQQYVVVDGKVQIVDEYTGRTMPDRQWQRGLHQLIEVKEGCSPSEPFETVGQITFQRFFQRYLWLAGMTGTAREAAAEIHRVYGLDVVRIASHRRARRRFQGIAVYGSEGRKLQAIARRVVHLAGRGRPVLIGTRSVATSDRVADALRATGIGFNLLNALQDADEAATIASAGQPGCVTIATNMAGRGTDIRLTPECARRGGLHVILTEFHESPRIDRQLYGRAGRQGDRGSCEAIVALDDELFRRFAPIEVGLARALFGFWPGRLPSDLGRYLRDVAQGRAEHLHRQIRRRALQQDEERERAFSFAGRGA